MNHYFIHFNKVYFITTSVSDFIHLVNLLPSLHILYNVLILSIVSLKHLSYRAIKGNGGIDYIYRLQSQNELSSNINFERCLFLLLW